MILTIKEPLYPLRHYVKAIIYYADYTAPSAYERILPDSHAQLIIALDKHRRYVTGCGGLPDQSLKNSWLTGIQTKPLTYRGEQDATVICIQFEDGGLFALTGIPADQLKNRVIEADSIGSLSLSPLREKLMNTEGVQNRLKKIVLYLTELMENLPDQGDVAAYVIDELEKGRLRLGEIADKSGYSRKQLIHIFKKYIGLPPKQFQIIKRFNQSLSQLSSADTSIYDSIYSDFYDQSHFIKDFRRLSSLSPGEYRELQKDYPHVLPLESLR